MPTGPYRCGQAGMTGGRPATDGSLYTRLWCHYRRASQMDMTSSVAVSCFYRHIGTYNSFVTIDTSSEILLRSSYQKSLVIFFSFIPVKIDHLRNFFARTCYSGALHTR